jgi:methylmalonyl-CoA/ethylmalonyl-CoA epimerase
MPNQTTSGEAMLHDAAQNLIQIGVVVRDLDRTVKYLTEIFGMGPFRYTNYPPDWEDMDTNYRGEPGDFSHRIAFTELGPVELEIIQPLTGESGLTEFLAEHGEGIQHIRFNVAEVQPVLDYLSGHDIEPLTSGSGLRPGTTWVHLDTVDKVGFVIEIMNTLPGTDGRTPQNLER